jgi:RNA polymerase sigma-70 factor (ECF subfamily)
VSQDLEAGLIERAKAYDQAALSDLYQRHAERIFRYVYYRVGNRMVAEDLTGEVFVQALEALPAYEHTGAPFSAWLYRIAHARIVDYYRRQKIRRTTPLDDQLPANNKADPGQTIAEQDAAHRAWTALPYLTDEQQQVLSLRFIAGYSIAEIARTMDRTEGSVKALQHRGLAALRRLLEKDRV